MNVSNLLLRITGDNDDAKRALREVAAELHKYAEEEFQAKIKLGGVAEAKRELDSLERALTIIGARDVTARVRVKIDKNQAHLANLRRELEHALSGGAGARPLEHIFADIAKIGTEVTQLGGRMAQFGGAAADAFGPAVGGAARLASTIGGALVSALISAAAQLALYIVAAVFLLPLVEALAAAVLALAASFGAALAGAGALLVALGGTFIPVLAVAIAAFVRLGGVVKALKEQEDNRAENNRKLAEAEKTASESRVEAIKAERDAVDQLRSAELAREEAKLGEGDAQLRLERARQKVKDLKDQAKAAGGVFEDLFAKLEDVHFRPDAALRAKIAGTVAHGPDELDVKEAMLELAHAQLGVKEAKERTIEATHRLADAQARENEFAREGLKAYEPYANSLRQVAAAKREAGDASDKLKKYSKEEISLGHEVLKVWDAIKHVFSQVSGPVFRGVVNFLHGLRDMLEDDAVGDALQHIGEAIGYVFTQFGKLLRTREVRRMFAELAEDGAKLTRIIGGRVFRDLALILTRIAVAAAPALIKLFQEFADWLDDLTDSTSNAGDLQDHIEGLVDSFRIWWDIIVEVGRIIISFIKDAKGEGDSFAETILRLLRRFNRFLNTDEGRRKVKEWLHDGIELVKRMVRAFIAVYNWIRDLRDPLSALIPVAEGFLKVVLKVLDGWRRILTAIGLVGRAEEKEAREKARRSVGPQADVIEKVYKDFQHSRGADRQRDKQRLIELLKNLEEEMIAAYGQTLGEKMFRKWFMSMGFKGFATGGRIPGVGGFGDNQMIMAEGGEYMIRRSVVNQIGFGALDALNSGRPDWLRHIHGGGRDPGYGIHIDKVELPPAPAAAIPDARYQAVQFARELARRGGG